MMRNGSGASMKQGMANTAGNHRKLGIKEEGRFPYRFEAGQGPAGLDLRLLASRT